MTDHKIVDPEQWQADRAELLEREKAHTRMGDELARQRRELPWVQLNKPYRFDTEEGPRTLAELFEGRSRCCSTTSCSGPAMWPATPSTPPSPTPWTPWRPTCRPAM